jgi:hypothetical protein
VQSEHSVKSLPQQVLTIPWSIPKIMGAAAFRRGFEQVRAGAAPDFDAEDIDDAWDYERGRLFACIAPLTMRLRVDGGKLNPKAITLFEAAGNRSFVV